jgi:hypothetical protein
MRRIFTALLLMAALAVEAQIPTPAASPAAMASTQVGLTDIKITYSRPRSKGRKIFGTGSDFLVPFGQLWRTGANNGTVINFSDDVEVEGKKVAKGDYLLLSTPGATEWSIVLYKDVAMGGNTTGYKAENEAAKFTVKAEKLTERVDMLTFNITDLSDDNTTAKIQLAWENTSVKFGVKVSFDEKVMKAIEANTKVSPNNYIAAARYYYETGKDLKKALEWMDLGIAGNPEAFWNIHLKAQILKASGDKVNALATAQKSLELAKKAPSDFGYIKQNEDLIKSLK